MDAKDTVMEGNQMVACYGIKANTTPGILWEDARKAVDVEIATRQAEISFKAGMQKVVEDFKTVLDAPVRYRWAMFFDVLNGWQEQLKEKGIEEIKEQVK